MNDIQKNYNQLLIRYDEILKENESLKALLRSHGIYYAGDMLEQIRDNPYSCLSVPAINLSLDDRVRLFQSYFKGREDARRWFSKTTERVTTNRFVKMNGDRTYVTRRDRSAPIVPIQCDYHGVLKIRTNINCPNIKTRVANPIHINAVCHLLMTLTSFSMTVSMVHLLFFNCIKSLFCDKYGNIVSSINQIDT